MYDILKLPARANISLENQNWAIKLKKRLIEKNNELVKKKKQPFYYPRQDHLFRVLNSQGTFPEKHCYLIEQSGHGPYSQYVSIKSNQCVPNEIVQCLPYIKHLSEKSFNLYEETLNQICQRVPTSSSVGEWSRVCRDFAPGWELPQLILACLRLMNEGTQAVVKMAKDLKCNERALLFVLWEAKRYFVKQSAISSLTMSIEKGEKVSLQTVSRTSKYIFCSICMTYDCNRHMVSSLSEAHNFQYIRAYDEKQRQNSRNKDILLLLGQLNIIFGGNKSEQIHKQVCSEYCYQLLTRQSWAKLSFQRKKKSFHPHHVLLIKIGIEMNGFRPCEIRQLFQSGPKQIRCEEIFYYLINEYGLAHRLSFKLFSSQYTHLLNENSSLVVPLSPKKANRRKKGKHQNKQSNENRQVSNAVCYHYFIDEETEDVNCMNCHCKERGYCLPQCQCSQNCLIRMKGCKCRGMGRCLDRCPCYKARRACIPEICENCAGSKKERQFRCLNNQFVFSRAKLTRVGNSTIKEAGLGLFAGEFIAKDAFVIKYLGQIVDSISLQKMRQNLSCSNMFYTFQLNKNEILDSQRFGNKARFMNHSQKEENVRPEVIKIREDDVLIFRALRDIKEGQELLFNYNGAGALNDFKERYPFIQ